MLLTPSLPTYSSRLFSWGSLRDFSLAIAEVSDLKGRTASGRLFGQVYDDAADKGFAVRSERTGVVTVFVCTGTSRNEDGDVEFETFSSVSPITGRLDGRWAVKLHND